MCDYSSQADMRRQALEEMVQISEEAGLYEAQAELFETIDVGPVKITGYPAAFVNLLSDEVDRLNAVIARVRGLHEQVTNNNAACGDPDCCGEYEEWEMCADCQCDYPCPTIQILDGEQ